jgi:N-acetylmuramoyl-L-alanine amidase
VTVSTLRRGDRGPAVHAVRERLVATGDLPSSEGEQDVYDATVEHAVRAFQQRRGMLVDGVVGPQTYRALDGARWLLGDRILTYTPGHLTAGDDVAALQERLLGLGYDCGRADGLFGAATESALRDFQHGIGGRPGGF